MRRYYLGLDGGGTNTSACILDENHIEVGRGMGGPCNIATGCDDSLRESLLSAIREAQAVSHLPVDTRFEAVCAGVAGYSAKGRRSEFSRLLVAVVTSNRHRIEPDFVIAWWGATEGEPGIIVIAGTGSVAYGRNAQGEACRWDGRGFLLGDMGSGFFVGNRALVATLFCLDQSLSLSPLSRAVMAATGSEDADDLTEWVYRNFDPGKIAGLATVVGRMAGGGDEEAKRHVEVAATFLRNTAQRVVSRLGMPNDTPIYALGGLWKLGAVLTEAFCRSCGSHASPLPSVELLQPLHDGAYGAALLAMRADKE